jgi:hypothetical protein
VSSTEEKLAGVDQALADLGKSDHEVSDVYARFAGGEPVDLEAVDGELGALSEGISVNEVRSATATVSAAVSSAVPEAEWDDEATEVEMIDESDFVLLVDEDDLEELEKVGEDDATKTVPPEIPQEAGEEGDGFFKKLFSGRRSRPPQQ